jgi:cell division protein FtsB
MQVLRYERAQYDKPAAEVKDSSLGPKLLSVLSKHLEKRNNQKNTEDFVKQCSDFDDRLRTFEMLEMDKLGHDADGAIHRGGIMVENLAAEKEFMSDELTDRFQVYAASRREGLLGRLAGHQMRQSKVALENTIQATIESRSKTVYANPDELVAELDLVKIDLDQLEVPGAPEVYNKIQAQLVDHAISGVVDHTPEVTQEYLGRYKKYLTQDQIEKYHDEALKAQTRQMAVAKKEKEKVVQEIQNDFINRMDELTPDEIRRSDLPPVGSGSKVFFLNQLDERDEAVVKDREKPYMTTNGAILAQLMIENADPGAIPLSASEILSYIPKEDGLSIADARFLINTTDVRKTSIFKNTEAALKAQFGYEGLLTGFGTKQLGSIYYNNAMTDIMEFLAEEPLRGLELRDKINEIAGPYLEQYMQEYKEPQEQIDKKLRLLGIKQSPALKVVTPKSDKKVLRWIPGKGWSE